MKNDRTSPMASVHLDFVRGASALAVLLSHGRALFFVNSDDLKVRGPVVKAFYFLSGFGHQAVLVFFVLSGYFISASIFRAHREGRWSWRSYLTDRGTRIYIVLVPALALTLFWDYLGMAVSPRAHVYNGLDDRGLFRESLAGDYSSMSVPAVVLGNLLCLETIVVPPLGSNPVLWSLAYEALYYVLFPLALLVVLPGRMWVERLACVAVLAALSLGLDIEKVFFLSIWCLGAVVAGTGLTPKSDGRSIPVTAVGLAIAAFGATLAASRVGWIKNPYLSDLAIGLSFTFLLLAVLGRSRPCDPGPYPVLAKSLSGFSYSLYLLHVPLLSFVRAILLPGDRVQPVPLHLLEFAGLLALVVAFAYVFALGTEARTGEVRRVVGRWVGVGRWPSERA